MKKFLVILCVVSLALYCFCLGLSASAEEFLTRDIFSGVSYSELVFYPSVTYSHPSVVIRADGTGFIIFDGQTVSISYLYLYRSAYNPVLVARASDSLEYILIDSDGFVNPLWDCLVHFDSPVSFGSAFVNWYNSFPNGMNGNVSDGVSSSIGWFGSVLSNLIASPYVLPLVGLSVALCFIIPFGISKIKELIKGY